MNTWNIVLWIIVVGLLVWVIYLQLNTEKKTTGYNSYHFSIVSTDDPNADICTDQKDLESYNYIVKVINKGDQQSWCTSNIINTQLDINKKFSLENSKVNTCYFIKTEGLGVLVSTLSLTPSTKITRYCVGNGEPLNNSYVILFEGNDETVAIIGLRKYTNIEGYKEHVKHLNYIITKLIGLKINLRIFGDVAIFRDHLEILIQQYAIDYGITSYSILNTNKLLTIDNGNNWLVVGSIELYRTTSLMSLTKPTYENPSRTSKNVVQLQYTRKGGLFNADVNTTTPISNFNIDISKKSNVIVNGNTIFNLTTPLSSNITTSIVNHKILLNDPLVQYFDDTNIKASIVLNTIYKDIESIESNLSSLILSNNNLQNRIVALEEGK